LRVGWSRSDNEGQEAAKITSSEIQRGCGRWLFWLFCGTLDGLQGRVNDTNILATFAAFPPILPSPLALLMSFVAASTNCCLEIYLIIAKGTRYIYNL